MLSSPLISVTHLMVLFMVHDHIYTHLRHIFLCALLFTYSYLFSYLSLFSMYSPCFVTNFTCAVLLFLCLICVKHLARNAPYLALSGSQSLDKRWLPSQKPPLVQFRMIDQIVFSYIQIVYKKKMPINNNQKMASSRKKPPWSVSGKKVPTCCCHKSLRNSPFNLITFQRPKIASLVW